MARAQAVWPPEGVPPGAAFNVLFIPEGFTAAQEPAFAALCRTFVGELLSTPPFGLLRMHPGRLAGWRLFRPSAQAGPALGGTPGDTLLRSTYDPVTHDLALDENRLLTELHETSLSGPGGFVLDGTALTEHEYIPRRLGVVVVLLPAVVGSTQISGELDAGPDIDDWGPSYLATTTDAGWERVVIRAIARGLGLGDEFSLAGAAYATAPPGQLINADRHPNLFTGTPPTGDPPLNFKWFYELSRPARQHAVTVVPYGQQSPTPAEPIQLFEGGGKYRAGIYRSAADCLMRRQIDGGSASPRYDSVPLCPLCMRSLIRVLHGREDPKKPVTMTSQRLVFDQVELWEHSETVTSFPFSRAVTGPTSRVGPWWEYQVSAGPAVAPGYGGLLIQSLRLMGQGSDSLAMPAVAERIEFRDIVVVLNNGDVVPFDMAAAFANTAAPPVLELVSDGRDGALHTNYLRGVKLTLEDDLNGRCPVQLELALTLKGQACDIDPGAQVAAVKLYPQIALTWQRGGSRRAVRFRACVRTLCNNKAVHTMDHGDLGSMPPDETVAAFFVDTNLATLLTRRLQVEEGHPSLPLPNPWTMLFDYHRPHLQYDSEMKAVYGPRAPAAKRSWRLGGTSWPESSTSTAVMSWKVGRQGAYDNVHLHGSMGDDPMNPSAGPMVHAPGCAEACVHLHWRWGMLAAAPVNDHVTDFFGWSGDGSEGSAHSLPGLPLIPPNQDLMIALTHPDTARADPLAPVVPGGQAGDALVFSGTALDPRRKAIWYTVDITAPAPDARQVVFEPGISFAFKYNWASSLLAAQIKCYRGMKGLPATVSDAQVLHQVYSYIRWFLDAAGHVTSAQIPAGDEAPQLEKM